MHNGASRRIHGQMLPATHSSAHLCAEYSAPVLGDLCDDVAVKTRVRPNCRLEGEEVPNGREAG